MVSRSGRLDPELYRQTTAWLQALTEQGGGFSAFALTRWEEEFCAVPDGELDPRYLGGLIVRLDH